MRAIRLHAFGPAENLLFEEVPDPVPAAGEVLIEVAAAGVHVLDTVLRQGVAGPGPGPAVLPTVPGREVAGTVSAVGPGADPVWAGRRVVAHIGMNPGGYAERIAVPAERLHEVPEGLDAAAAVAMIGTGRTAMGIVQFAEPGPDDVVVVPAAAGGLGTLLVQHARNAGAVVVGLAGGAAKVARVRAAGADLAVDYREPSWAGTVRAFLDAGAGRPGTPRGATIVYDGVGGDTARAAVHLLAPGGTHVVFGWFGHADPLDAGPHRPHETYLKERGISSREVLGPVMLERAGGENPLRTLELRSLSLAARGSLVPAVTRYPLAEAARAHRELEGRLTVGKVVLEP
ncbi:zinc-binding dehydrogenase [Streptomyces sp. LE64]|uniref:zinc-binding dehydrogenase n=1 Tax=Streptomyces sp. LE64 TaxID=3448653 RepID=UPI0040412501